MISELATRPGDLLHLTPTNQVFRVHSKGVQEVNLEKPGGGGAIWPVKCNGKAEWSKV